MASHILSIGQQKNAAVIAVVLLSRSRLFQLMKCYRLVAGGDGCRQGPRRRLDRVMGNRRCRDAEGGRAGFHAAPIGWQGTSRPQQEKAGPGIVRCPARVHCLQRKRRRRIRRPQPQAASGPAARGCQAPRPRAPKRCRTTPDRSPEPEQATVLPARRRRGRLPENSPRESQ